MSDDLGTDREITWCPGCGNFGILNASKKAVRKLEADHGIPRSRLMMVTGIGCHAKMINFFAPSGLYGLHGRGHSSAQGVKNANPDLKVLSFGGDGDSYGEGIEHILFAAKRNSDIVSVIHNNGAYALTTGQFSPTAPRGHKGPSTPRGSFEDPLNPLVLLLEAGATFVARGFAGEIDHLSDLIVEATLHQGFAIIDVLQPSVVFTNRFEEYNEKCEKVDDDPGRSKADAVALAREIGQNGKIPIGIFYREQKAPFHDALLEGHNPVGGSPSREARLGSIRRLLK